MNTTDKDEVEFYFKMQEEMTLLVKEHDEDLAWAEYWGNNDE